GLVGEERPERGVAAEDLGAGFFDAGGAEAVGLARPAERGAFAVLAAGDGLVAPFRVEGARVGGEAVRPLHQGPDGVGRERDDLLQSADRIHSAGLPRGGRGGERREGTDGSPERPLLSMRSENPGPAAVTVSARPRYRERRARVRTDPPARHPALVRVDL